MNRLYPALTQTNCINPNNFKNYVNSARATKPIVDEQDNIHRGETYWNQVEFDGFRLPGQGRSKPYCKKWVSWGCDNTNQHPNNLHYAEHEQKTCKTSGCPLCFESWINRQSNRSTRRLSKFVENKKYSFRHVVLSPPQKRASRMSIDELKEWLVFALKVGKIQTCAIIFHPFRFHDREKIQPFVSPHFHLLVYGKITDTIEFHNKTRDKEGNGWLIKNKGNLKTDVDIFNCVRYLLSHAGVRKKTHSIKYLGDVSYRKLKIEKEPQKHVCPYCKLPLTVFFIRNSLKSKKPPINFVGLWESSCFKLVEPTEDMKNIPFYELRVGKGGNYTNDKSDYWEDLIYSFEELLSITTNLSIIKKAKRSYKISQKKFLDKSFDCKKLDDFVIY